MAFLDKLVSDLIRKSTGFNARPFVRAVGGRNILLLGGAAIAGALAAEKMRGPGAEAAPPPPPLPPEAVPPPPPLPMEAAEPPIPHEFLFAVVRTMAAAALADGEMHADEKKLIEGRLDESGLSSDETRQIRKDLVIPPSPEDLARSVTTSEDRELLYRFGALVVLSDGDAAEVERVWLDRLGRALGLAPESRAALEREILPSGP